MNKILISFIVPIYNVEKFLFDCLYSLKIQEGNDLEFLLIIDGSKDRSDLISIDFMKVDRRFKVFFKENGGLSDARNFGLLRANGKYVFFLDSDDYIEKSFVSTVREKLLYPNIDILAIDAFKIDINNHISKISHTKGNINIYSGIEFLYLQLKTNKMLMAVWMRIYNKEFLVSNNFYFEKGLIHEDEEWTPRVILKAKKIIHLDYCGYFYISREGSITNKPNKINNYLSLIYISQKMEIFYKNYSNHKIITLLNDHNLNIYLNGVYPLYSISYKKNYYNRSFLLKNSYHIKTKIKSLLFYISPFIYNLINKLTKMF